MKIGTIKYRRELWDGYEVHQIVGFITDSPLCELVSRFGEEGTILDVYDHKPSGFYSLTKRI